MSVFCFVVAVAYVATAVFEFTVGEPMVALIWGLGSIVWALSGVVNQSTRRRRVRS